MDNQPKKEITAAIILIILLILLLNPFGFWMPSTLVMILLGAAVVIFLFFASFIWSEAAGDEREALHRAAAGRAAFLTGAAVLVAGIIYQELRHSLDPWLIYALGSMVLAKILALAYSKKYK